MMNQEQREYTVKKIEKNKEIIEVLEKNAVDCAAATGLVIIVCTLSALGLNYMNINASLYNDIQRKIAEFVIGAGGITGISSFSFMIVNLARRAGLKVTTENLEDILTKYSLDSENQIEESKGRTR